MAKKILSFEEYSAKVTGPQIEETEMEDVAQDDVEETEDEHITTLQWLIRLGIKPKNIRQIIKK